VAKPAVKKLKRLPLRSLSNPPAVALSNQESGSITWHDGGTPGRKKSQDAEDRVAITLPAFCFKSSLGPASVGSLNPRVTYQGNKAASILVIVILLVLGDDGDRCTRSRFPSSAPSSSLIPFKCLTQKVGESLNSM